MPGQCSTARTHYQAITRFIPYEITTPLLEEKHGIMTFSCYPSKYILSKKSLLLKIGQAPFLFLIWLTYDTHSSCPVENTSRTQFESDS